tara:strand:- start:8045 stop:8950 length:906 start_codon:yes stop_codon:yes gene_type:complete
MKVLITGATGLIGSRIVKDCLESDIKVNFLTTRKNKIDTFPGCNGFYWNPQKNIIDLNCFNQVDSIINLSGASIFRIWTKKNKELILKSRVQSLNFLRKQLIENNIKIQSIVSASGIGVYPSSYDKEFNESESKRSYYFLSDVIKEWEKATMSFERIVEKVSIVRIGLVLSSRGGVLKQTMQPMSFGFGVYFGSGRQWQSWVHIKDISQIFIYIIKNKLSGLYNGVAPNPISNYEFTKIISQIKKYVLFIIPLPRFFFRLIFGDMHIILFKSQKVSSKKIEQAGFNFKFRKLKNSVKDILS